MDHLAGPLHVLLDLVEGDPVLLKAVAFLELLVHEEVLHPPGLLKDHGLGVVDLVGHARGHLPQGRQLVRLDELGVQLVHALVGLLQAGHGHAGREHRGRHNGQEPRPG